MRDPRFFDTHCRRVRFLTFLGALALVLGQASAAGAQPCNGAEYLCGRRYDQVTYPTNHNSHASTFYGFHTPNQERSIPGQLQDGVRGLMWDTWYHQGTAALCHQPVDANCISGYIDLRDALKGLKQFLDAPANRREVVTLIFENHIALDGLVEEFANAQLLPYLLSYDVRGWPTLQQMIDSNRRVVVFVSDLMGGAVGPNGAWVGASWMHYEFALAFETPFRYSCYIESCRGLGYDRPGYCDPERGGPAGLYILNHFITPPGTTAADHTNPYSFLLSSARYCQGRRNRLPNFLTVDYYNHPAFDVLEVVRKLNANALVCPPEVRADSATGQCSAAVHFPPLVHRIDEGSLTAEPASGSTFAVGTASVTARTHFGASPGGQAYGQSCSFPVVVRDAEAPVITPRNLEVPTDAGHCSARVNVDPPPIADNCAGAAVSSGSRSDGQPLTAPYPKGLTTIAWQGADTAGNAGSAGQTVLVRDAEKPAVSCEVAFSFRSAEGDLVNVGLSVRAVDKCAAAPGITVSVYSNEDDEGPGGTSRFSPDAKEIAPVTLRLRGERDNRGGGRVYLIAVEADDGAGNVGTCSTTVVVPKSNSRPDVAAVNALAATTKRHYDRYGVPPAGFFTIGDGPVIGPKQ